MRSARKWAQVFVTVNPCLIVSLNRNYILSYPHQEQKLRYIQLFFFLFSPLYTYNHSTNLLLRYWQNPLYKLKKIAEIQCGSKFIVHKLGLISSYDFFCRNTVRLKIRCTQIRSILFFPTWRPYKSNFKNRKTVLISDFLF